MTFQLNSDVLLSYGSVVPLPAAADAAAAAAAAAAHSAQVASWFTSKRRVAAWTVSHCYTVSRREEYAARLREHVTVDIYGKCAGVWGKVLGLGHAHQMDMLRRECAFACVCLRCASLAVCVADAWRAQTSSIWRLRTGCAVTTSQRRRVFVCLVASPALC